MEYLNIFFNDFLGRQVSIPKGAYVEVIQLSNLIKKYLHLCSEDEQRWTIPLTQQVTTQNNTTFHNLFYLSYAKHAGNLKSTDNSCVALSWLAFFAV